MINVLVSKEFVAAYGDAFKAVAQGAGETVEFMTLPEEPGARLSQAECDRIDCTFQDRDIRFNNDQIYAAYSDALVATKSCRWIHVTSSGINPTPWIAALDKRGATITSAFACRAARLRQPGADDRGSRVGALVRVADQGPGDQVCGDQARAGRCPATRQPVRGQRRR